MNKNNNNVIYVGIVLEKNLMEKNLMFCKFRSVKLLYLVLGIAVIFGLAGGCNNPEQYKADADEEVYKIIDSKWQDGFGQKANYIISDSNIPQSPTAIQLEATVPVSGTISLSEALKIATANNRDYREQKEILYRSAISLTGTRYQYALQWFGTIDGTYTDNKSSGDDDVTIGTSTGAQTAKDKGFLLDSVLFKASIAVDWVRYLTGAPRTSLGSVLSSSASLPLLGAGAGKQARENLTQAERSVLYQIRTFNRYRKRFVVDVVSQYYSILENKDRVINAENSYDRLVESKKKLEMQVEAGQARPFDVDENEQKVLSAENSWVSAQQTYESLLDQFKITLSLPTDAKIELDPDELKALEKLGISQPDYTLDTAIETARHWRLDLANSADAVDDAERKVELAAEGLGIQLNLTGSTDVSSAEKTKVERLQFQKGTYALGFNADLPFDRKTKRNAYRESLITLEQKQRAYENDQDNMELDMRGALRDLKAKAEQYRIQQKALELANRRLENQELLIDIGKGEVRLLLESEADLLKAQNDVTAALVNHAIAKLGFFRDVGVLQVKPDGMWEEKQ